MKKQEELDPNDLLSSLPLDLKLEILSKLPAKSIPKFIFVSNHWASIVRGKELAAFFVHSRSSSIQPSLLLKFETVNTLEFFSSSSPEEPTCGTTHGTIFTPKSFTYISTPIRGLVCGQALLSANKVICNVATGQFVTLPPVRTKRRTPNDIHSFLGYDPVNDVYKVLSMTVRYVHPKAEAVVSQEHQVFTLGARRKAWRMIECKIPHCPSAAVELCKDGVLYYGASYDCDEERYRLVSFDLATEDFGVIKLPEHVQLLTFCYTRLVNYLGRIALVDDTIFGNVDVWVLQDVKKQEWFKISVLLPRIDGYEYLHCRGTIHTGELIFAPWGLTKPYFILYHDLKGNKTRRVYIEDVPDGDGIGFHITFFLDHIESPMFLH